MIVLKPYMSAFLRRFRLLAGVEKLRFFLKRRTFKNSNTKFLNEHPDIEIPPDFFLYETYMLHYELYYKDGLETAREIVNLLGRRYNILQKDMRCLDWGCGPARVTRHLPGLLPGVELHGADYNERYINWCKSKIKGIQFKQTHISPPTLYADAYFSIVIGLSVFTHLSELNHYAWLNELYRIIKPGGVLFITTQGKSYAHKLSVNERQKFNEAKLIVRDGVLEGNRLFSAFQPPHFVKSFVKDKFEVIEFIPGKANRKSPEQDKWMLKKI